MGWDDFNEGRAIEMPDRDYGWIGWLCLGVLLVLWAAWALGGLLWLLTHPLV